MRRRGLTPDDYLALLAKQGGVCAICGVRPNKKRLALDHCHKTDKLRGLLCDTCNRGLGMFHDDPLRLYAAIEYLALYWSNAGVLWGLMKITEQRVNTLLKEFDKWFQSRGNEPLVGAEVAIVKTFAWFLIHIQERSKMPVLEEKVEGDAQDSGGDPVQPVRASGDAFRTPTAPAGVPPYAGVRDFGLPDGSK